MKLKQEKKNMNKIEIAAIIAVVIVFVFGWLAFCGYQWSWGPFEKLHGLKTAVLPGNGEIYSPDLIKTKTKSPLKGKKILFFGSSVTYGASSKGVSFVEYLQKETGCIAIKNAVSGTTLVDNGTDSYISRLKNEKENDIDVLVCQLSTNDATQKKSLGEISESENISELDTHTVAGAIEYIILYAKKKWNCPVVFFTNPKYKSNRYDKTVTLLLNIRKKYNIEVIDLWNDGAFNDLTEEQRKLYMADKIHPTKAGYCKWWTPVFEKKLVEVINDESNKFKN